ncbi:uncharacterized protein HaLaN_02470, partial [Haematococcus lacustris]
MGWHNDAEAKRLLTDAAAQVQPIMRKRGWIVPLLTEFYPPNACLLGLNIGGGGAAGASPCLAPTAGPP